jgi:hypothetical protein
LSSSSPPPSCTASVCLAPMHQRRAGGRARTSGGYFTSGPQTWAAGAKKGCSTRQVEHPSQMRKYRQSTKNDLHKTIYTKQSTQRSRR